MICTGGVVYFGKKSHIGTLDCNSNLGIQDSNRFELMRFAVFKEIEEYLEENRNGFVPALLTS